jgi:hypothetical protein
VDKCEVWSWRPLAVPVWGLFVRFVVHIWPSFCWWDYRTGDKGLLRATIVDKESRKILSLNPRQRHFRALPQGKTQRIHAERLSEQVTVLA